MILFIVGWVPISPLELKEYCLGMHRLRLYMLPLRPLLFLLFLNDLPCAISDGNILMYVDDVKLCYT